MRNALVFLMLGTFCAGATVTVDPAGGGDFSEIQAAVDAASGGGTVVVEPGVYEVVTLLMAPGVELVSSGGPDVTTIMGVGTRSTVWFRNCGDQCLIQGFTITGGGGSGGGGISVERCSPQIVGNVITGNSAVLGGGIKVNGTGDPSLTQPRIMNNIIVANSATYGGGIGLANGWGIVVNNTIVGNSATLLGGGMSYTGANFNTILNNIIAGNTCNEYSASMNGGGGGLYNISPHGTQNSVVDHNDIWDNTEDQLGQGVPGLGANNLFADPLFVDSANGDYQLEQGSPCIDMGTPDEAPESDFLGTPRLSDAGVDIGAFEYFCEPEGPQFVRGDANMDQKITIRDAVFIIRCLVGRSHRRVPPCLDAADANDDGQISFADAILIIRHRLCGRFRGRGRGRLRRLTRQVPPSPWPECGMDPTEDMLTCETFEPCQ